MWIILRIRFSAKTAEDNLYLTETASTLRFGLALHLLLCPPELKQELASLVNRLKENNNFRFEGGDEERIGEIVLVLAPCSL